MRSIQVLFLALVPSFAGCVSAGHGHGHDALSEDASKNDALASDTTQLSAETGTVGTAQDGGDSATDGRGAEASVQTPLGTAGTIGDDCTDASTCPAGGSGAAVCLRDGYPGGYCAVANCAVHGHDCPGDATTSKCVLAPTATCLRLCATDSGCRLGYVCTDEADAAGHGSFKVCMPK